ncbi:MAG TPA: hypothetical protein VF796_17420, partial [Humisphaera sp.]
MLARPPRSVRWLALAFLLAAAATASGSAAAAVAVRVSLPLGRDVYRTDERIPLAVVRAAPTGLPAGDLAVDVTGDADGSRLRFTFPRPAAAASDAAPAVDHLWVDARHLAPGRYAVTAAFAGSTGSARLLVVSHVRRSSFRTLAPAGLRIEGTGLLGDDGLGFDTVVGGAAKPTESARALAEEQEYLFRVTGDRPAGGPNADPAVLRRLADDAVGAWAASRSWPHVI